MTSWSIVLFCFLIVDLSRVNRAVWDSASPVVDPRLHLVEEQRLLAECARFRAQRLGRELQPGLCPDGFQRIDELVHHVLCVVWGWRHT